MATISYCKEWIIVDSKRKCRLMVIVLNTYMGPEGFDGCRIRNSVISDHSTSI